MRDRCPGAVQRSPKVLRALLGAARWAFLNFAIRIKVTSRTGSCAQCRWLLFFFEHIVCEYRASASTNSACHVANFKFGRMPLHDDITMQHAVQNHD
jgi:hypothetical protein